MMKTLLRALAVLCFAVLLSGCSDTPSETVQKDFFDRQHLTPEMLKQRMESGTPKEQELVKIWSVRELRQAAEGQSKYLRGAVLRIDSENIAGNTATVKATIIYAGGQTEEVSYTLKKSGRKWQIQPEAAKSGDAEADTESDGEPENDSESYGE